MHVRSYYNGAQAIFRHADVLGVSTHVTSSILVGLLWRFSLGQLAFHVSSSIKLRESLSGLHLLLHSPASPVIPSKVDEVRTQCLHVTMWRLA